MRLKRLTYFYACCAVLAVSCSSKVDEKVINAKEVIPSSNYKAKTTNSAIMPVEDFGFSKDTAVLYGLEYDSIYLNDDPFFPERFLPKTAKKLVLKTGIDSTIWYHLTFKDSIKTNNALYNWLDCFDKNCKSIKLYEHKKLQKDNFLLFVTDTSLTYICSSALISKSDWLQYYKLHSGIVNWKLIIQQKKNSKVEWQAIKGDEEINLTKK
jgi:hypothetical protein